VRGYLRAGAVVTIIDPDGGAWPRGCRMVGAPDDYEAIAQELEQLAALSTSRRAEFQRGRRVFDPILVLIDEAPVVLRRTQGAVEQVADLARRGRKLGMSLILLAQDTQTRTLGLEGQSQLLEAFERLDCRMTPTGVALLAGDELRSMVPLDHGATDLVLPLATDQPSVSNSSLPLVERLLAQALANTDTTPAINVAADCNAECPEDTPLRNEALQLAKLAESLPADVAQRIASIDWRTVATLVAANAIGETAALRALGFPASSTSVKYQVAKARLHAALGKTAHE
jgi:hypothetical protein